ncbi:MAG: TIGR03905 family TSCPD domain-containing protein [Butyricicoccus sp.]|nr:TIGR03905 family TSCPD domain-containing protein [Butyricicoccus pullicaecorum]MCI6719782.1 TIGR03905 family TSCPD domain-containing protein [Clostridiales bacterium]MDY5972831.1 TIGR03905 family TSCPD domain-containing protein [Butyricicoccus sp.]
MHYMYCPKGVCSRLISFDLDGDVVHNVEFVGGCNGNLKAISKVVDGMTVEQIEGYFQDIDCGGRGTSCSAQLAQGVREALEKAKQQ